jgi:hypothetical protein
MLPDLETIKHLLLTEWDPIGVNGIPEAVDEYDMYAMPILSMLREGAGEQAVADYLEYVVVDRMGLNSNMAYSRKIAQRIVESVG